MAKTAAKPVRKARLDAAQPSPAPPRRVATAPTWVKVMVALHIFCITVWAIPRPSSALLSGKVKPFGSDYIRIWVTQYLKTLQPVQAYLFTTGTWQYWDMFAPNPASVDWWCDAIVVYKNGQQKVYQYPRMALLPIPLKYVKERYRKFYERAHDDQYSYLFPVFGLRIALLNYSDPSNPPVKVELRRHWRVVADPGQPQTKPYSWYCYFTYVVDQAQLRREAAMSP